MEKTLSGDDAIIARYLGAESFRDIPSTPTTSATPQRRQPLRILQRVVSRKLCGVQANPKTAPGHIVFYAVEFLECGHKHPVHQDGLETFTARRRSCHQCLEQFIEKSAESVKLSTPKRAA